jgi:hypothetical protein
MIEKAQFGYLVCIEIEQPKNTDVFNNSVPFEFKYLQMYINFKANCVLLNDKNY